MKKPITTWKLLIWAYRIQMVQYDTDWYDDSGRDDGAGARSDFDWALAPARDRTTAAHPDAHIVHSYVRDLKWGQGKLIVDSASKRQPPNWDPQIPPLRIVPSRYGGSGRIRMIYGLTRKGRKSHKEIGSWIEYEGVSDAEANAIRTKARAVYTTWWEALRQLTVQFRGDDVFQRWRIVDIGAIREPWKKDY